MNWLKQAVTLSVLFGATFAQANSRHQCTSKSLKPTHESLVRQNEAIDQMGLERIQNEFELSCLVKAGILVALPNTDAVKPAPSLPANRRYALPRTVFFLLSLSEAYRQQFGKALTVDSAVRPKSVQERLRRTNRAAAPVDGETASSHESGTTFDLSKKMPRAQLQWLRNMLGMYQAYDVVIVEEEKNCLHIMVLE
ncbi:MAG: DUF5715 family protein [Halobacteriota archaeon]